MTDFNTLFPNKKINVLEKKKNVNQIFKIFLNNMHTSTLNKQNCMTVLAEPCYLNFETLCAQRQVHNNITTPPAIVKTIPDTVSTTVSEPPTHAVGWLWYHFPSPPPRSIIFVLETRRKHAAGDAQTMNRGHGSRCSGTYFRRQISGLYGPRLLRAETVWPDTK